MATQLRTWSIVSRVTNSSVLRWIVACGLMGTSGYLAATRDSLALVLWPKFGL